MFTPMESVGPGVLFLKDPPPLLYVAGAVEEEHIGEEKIGYQFFVDFMWLWI